MPVSNAPSAASPGSIEKVNVQLVKDFCKAWGDDPPDADDMVNKYLADDCLVRFGDTIEPVTGHDAAIALFQTFLSNGERYDLKILETFSRGPVVVIAFDKAAHYSTDPREVAQLATQAIALMLRSQRRRVTFPRGPSFVAADRL